MYLQSRLRTFIQLLSTKRTARNAVICLYPAVIAGEHLWQAPQDVEMHKTLYVPIFRQDFEK